MISQKIITQDIRNNHNYSCYEFCINKILRLKIWLYKYISQISNKIVALFDCVLTELSFCLVEGVISCPKFWLEISNFSLYNLSNSLEWITSRIFGFVPVEIIKIFWDRILFLSNFNIPVMTLLFLQVQILTVYFLQKTFNSTLKLE